MIKLATLGTFINIYELLFELFAYLHIAKI